MKKLSKCVTWVLVLALLIMSVPVFADDGGKVEITFSVGDDTLMINGEAVQVEKPYVVGEGVTLVPLRVITEAFGATVEWVQQTQTINLSYPDVEIVLQINNLVAEVNKKAETLLSAPELTANGYTMVPLRFISETFGAAVSYDETTKGITVIKENAQSGGTVVGTIDAANIGDSFYGWSMENPTDMQMSERNFDGTYTSFYYDDNNGFDISIYAREDDFDLEREFIEAKSSFAGLTLVKADKDTSNSKKQFMHFQVKDKNTFSDIWQYATEEYIFLVWGEFENENNDIREEGIRILETFDCVFDNAEAHDLSTVENGMRRFTVDSMKFAVDIPENFYMASSEDVENEALFASTDLTDYDSSITINIFSKSDAGSAEELAKGDYEINRKIMNEAITTISDVSEGKEYKNISAYEYTMDIDGAATDRRARDVFFELGEYVYNVRIDIKTPNDKADEIIDNIINSIEVQEIDPNEVGILMRNMPDEEGTYAVKSTGWSMNVPNSYYSGTAVESGVVLQSMRSGIMASFNIADAAGATVSDVRNKMLENENNIKQQAGTKIIQSTKQVTYGGITYSELVYTSEDEDTGMYYVHQLAGVKGNKLVVYIISSTELAYSTSNITEMNEIISSLKIG